MSTTHGLKLYTSVTPSMSCAAAGSQRALILLRRWAKRSISFVAWIVFFAEGSERQSRSLSRSSRLSARSRDTMCTRSLFPRMSRCDRCGCVRNYLIDPPGPSEIRLVPEGTRVWFCQATFGSLISWLHDQDLPEWTRSSPCRPLSRRQECLGDGEHLALPWQALRFQKDLRVQ